MTFTFETRANPVQLWAQANHFFAHMIATYGDAAALAAIDELARTTRRHLLEWLAPLETLARKLLLIEASKLTGALPPLSACKRSRGECRGEAEAPDLNHPASWRAPFYMPIPVDDRGAVPESRAPRIRLLGPSWPPRPAFTPPPQPAPRPRTERTPPSTWRIARRVEALRRLIENPAPHARRLARRLSRIPRHARAERARRIASASPSRHARDLERPLRDGAILGSIAAENVCNSS
jgi:hypothetical protein